MAFNFVPNTASSATLQASSILIFCHKRALFFKPLLFNQSPSLLSAFKDCWIFCSEWISASAWLVARCAWFCCSRNWFKLVCKSASSARCFCSTCSIPAISFCACCIVTSLVFNWAWSGNTKLDKSDSSLWIRWLLSSIFWLKYWILLFSIWIRWFVSISICWLFCAKSSAVLSANSFAGKACTSASNAALACSSACVAVSSSVCFCVKFCWKSAPALALRSSDCVNCNNCCVIRSRASVFCLTWFSRL